MKFRSFLGLLLAIVFAAGTAGAASPDWHDLLSRPTYQDIRFRMYQVPMPDGVKLSTAVWRPDVPGERFPVIMLATPYDKFLPRNIHDALFFAHRGYAYVAYDIRGRYNSEGISYLYGPKDGSDLNAMQTWAGEQPWSSGKIGMYGSSYLGFIQWEGALYDNPHLAALVPEVSPDDNYDNLYPSGAFQLSNSLGLIWNCCGGRTNYPEELINWERFYWHLPISDDARYLGVPNTGLWNDWLSHPMRDSYWQGPGERIAPGRNGPGQYDKVLVPTFNISGWYDQVSQATINNYIGMSRFGPPQLRRYQRLVMGPWTHPTLFKRHVGQLTFPSQAAPNRLDWLLRWYDYWLKGMHNGFAEQPPVYIYVMGVNRWRSECEWPLARAQYTNYYLHSAGRANSLLGDGTLSQSPPSREPLDEFTYDPKNPVPSLGGNVNMQPRRSGPYDQRAIELRSDVLVYTTPPLEHDIEVTGPVILRLYASTDRKDTDFTGKLVDVSPDGNAKILLEGIIRGRFNRSFRKEHLLKPNHVYDFYIDLWSTSNVFLRGHRIRIEVSSSNFPKYDRNPNTGTPFGQGMELLLAHQKVHHDGEYPSHIILPIIPAGSAPCEQIPPTSNTEMQHP